MKPEFATHYERRTKNTLDCSKGEPSKTQQHMKDECDINVIMKRYQTKGILPTLIKENPQFGDFSEVPDYQEAYAIVQKAQLQFESLPASVRREFDHNPAKFLEFTHNPANMKRMIEMGLAIDSTPVTKPINNDKTEVAK